MKIKKYISGIQPTGSMHIGNYFGAIKQFVNISQSEKCMFFIADLHAMTTDLNSLNENSLYAVASYVASGINLENASVFRQSEVYEHLEIMWFLSSIAQMGELSLMTQYKSKSGGFNNLSLFSYPVLMASDILIHGATHVPVGVDQKQHIELARRLAKRANKVLGENVFVTPEVVTLKSAAKIMSLQDGSKKMSKSDLNDKSRINLTDSDDVIVKKIRQAKTDSMDFESFEKMCGFDDAKSDLVSNNFNLPDDLICSVENDVKHDFENPFNESGKKRDDTDCQNLNMHFRSDVVNLVNIMSLFTGKSHDEICNKYIGTKNQFSNFKKDLAEVAVNYISPIRSEIKNLLNNEKDYLLKILEKGRGDAKKSSSALRNKIYNKILY